MGHLSGRSELDSAASRQSEGDGRLQAAPVLRRRGTRANFSGLSRRRAGAAASPRSSTTGTIAATTSTAASSASSSASTTRKSADGPVRRRARTGSPISDIHELRGPTNPSLNYECGLLIDGFDSPPTFMMTYNPPYYARLIENYGFRKSQDLYAFWGHIDMLPQARQEARFRLPSRSSSRFNVKLFARLDKSQLSPEKCEMFLPHLQPLAGEHLGLRADVGRRDQPAWPGR